MHLKHLCSVTAPAVAAILASSVICMSAAAAERAVLSDDFNDDVIGNMWSVYEPDPDIIQVIEQNQRLELPAEAPGGASAIAGIYGNEWLIAPSEDFYLHIDWHFDRPAQSGDSGLTAAIVFAGTPGIDGIEFGALLHVGSDADGPYVGFEVVMFGAVVADGYDPLPVDSGTAHVWYDSEADVLAVSLVEYGDPDATLVPDLGTASESEGIAMFLGGFTLGDAPAMPGEDAYIDNFVIEEGEILGWPVCPADLTGDGVVDVLDLLEVLAAWGPCPDCPEDITGDGIVDVLDLLEILSAWGPCE